jgi:hypothetical protein
MLSAAVFVTFVLPPPNSISEDEARTLIAALLRSPGEACLGWRLCEGSLSQRELQANEP